MDVTHMNDSCAVATCLLRDSHAHEYLSCDSLPIRLLIFMSHIHNLSFDSCVTHMWLICDSYVTHMWLICVTLMGHHVPLLKHMCDIIELATWLLRDMTQLWYTCDSTMAHNGPLVSHIWLTHVLWQHASMLVTSMRICVTSISHMCATSTSSMRATSISHMCDMHQSFVCDTTESYVCDTHESWVCETYESYVCDIAESRERYESYKRLFMWLMNISRWFMSHMCNIKRDESYWLVWLVISE